MKKYLMLSVLLSLFMFGNSYGQCNFVTVENALDCEITVTIKAYCNNILVESSTITLDPGTWANPSINHAPVNDVIWCSCLLNPCPIDKIYYGSIDITNSVLCCPDVKGDFCSDGFCAEFFNLCDPNTGILSFKSRKPPGC